MVRSAVAVTLSTVAGAILAATAPGSIDPTTMQSNWAGYVATAPHVSFTSVTGAWTQPHVRCKARHGSASAIWVGLGGYAGESELEQIGTDANCDASRNQVSYAWFALVPYPAHRIKLILRPGDHVRASVALTSPNIDVRLENLTRHWVFARSIAVPAAASSAEWVVEAPVLCTHSTCREPALANFGAVTMSALSATGNGEAGSVASPSWAATPVTLVPGSLDTVDPASAGDVKLRLEHGTPSTAGAKPDQPSQDGSTFTVKWHP